MPSSPNVPCSTGKDDIDVDGSIRGAAQVDASVWNGTRPTVAMYRLGRHDDGLAASQHGGRRREIRISGAEITRLSTELALSAGSRRARP